MNLDAFAIYKNVFCWLCNAETKTEVPALCPDLHGDTLRSPLGSSSALIDLKRMEEANGDSNSGSRQCSAGEMLDKYMVSQGESIAKLQLWFSIYSSV